MTSFHEVLSILADKDAMEMFVQIATGSNPNPEDYLTVKRYYTRLHILREQGLIKKHPRKRAGYRITATGRVILELMRKVQRTCDLSWKLQAIDEMDPKIPAKERDDVIKMLVPNKDIQKIVLGDT